MAGRSAKREAFSSRYFGNVSRSSAAAAVEFVAIFLPAVLASFAMLDQIYRASIQPQPADRPMAAHRATGTGSFKCTDPATDGLTDGTVRCVIDESFCVFCGK